MRTIQYEVNVEKSVDLRKNEGLNEFSEKLRDAGAKYIHTKLNLAKEDYAYVAEIFQNSAIFSVYKSASSSKPGYAYYAATYKRDDAGAFAFDTLAEVVRKTIWEPKTVSIAKATETAEVSADGAPVAVQKQLWNGIL